MSFANPGYLFLLLLLIPVIVWYLYELRKSDASVQISDTSTLAAQPKSWRIWLLHVPFGLRVAAITLLSLALARPQLTNRWSSESTEGIDIMMALDISGTMLAEDLRPNRLEAAKQVASDFVIARPNDQIGLVVFAGESFTQCPLTTDHAVLVNLFKSVEYGMIEDGTAIGLGLANAVNPQTAAQIAKTYGIRVYTVGVGSYGQTRVPVKTPMGMQYVTMDSEFDDGTLRGIAETTGGQYFRATDNTSLKRIYEQIDQLEKTKLRVREYSKHTENFAPFLFAALACLLIEVILRYFVLRTIAQ